VEFENGGLTLKTHQMFSGHIKPQEFKNATIIGILDFCLRKTHSARSHDARDAIVFEKLRFQNVSAHTKTKTMRFQIPAFLKSSVFMEN